MTRYNMKTITTPIGTARYCYLTKPSTGEYDGEYGTYRTELILDKADWDKLKAQLQPEYEAAYLAENTKQGKELKKANSPFVIDGEDHIVKLKMKAGGKRKDGSEYKLSVALFDSQGNPMKGDDIIGGGSRIKIGMKVMFWYVAAHGFGMRLEPQGVQVLELAAVGTSEKATSFGFTAEEGGYTNGGETFENTLDQPEPNAEKTKQETPMSADF
ncbi:MAG: putative helix-destabilizing protein [Prokaryotic dsDNA virus sp.]|nr:MAG: putative helix-destabilizing protein [Prokaryotic dsDNA virus sp.]